MTKHSDPAVGCVWLVLPEAPRRAWRWAALAVLLLAVTGAVTSLA